MSERVERIEFHRTCRMEPVYVDLVSGLPDFSGSGKLWMIDSSTTVTALVRLDWGKKKLPVIEKHQPL